MEVPREIEDNLYPNEQIMFSLKKKFGLQIKPAFLIITDRRVIVLDQKILGRYEMTDVPYEKLEFVRFKRGKVGSEFLIKSEDLTPMKLTWLEKDEALSALNAIRDALNAIAVEPVSIKRKKGIWWEEWEIIKPAELITRATPIVKPVSHDMKEDKFEQLKKLKELYDMGIISQEEYEEKRKKILEQI
ncbi:MAG: hypothetical protein DRP01_03850 [Archaeoglobales archaeon]|nr:MAG: hypothetical protein DRP01_03850 [Archaeoglobales archaeon]